MRQQLVNFFDQMRKLFLMTIYCDSNFMVIWFKWNDDDDDEEDDN